MVSLVTPAMLERAVEAILPSLMASSTSLILVAPMSMRPVEVPVATSFVKPSRFLVSTSVTEPRSTSRREPDLRVIVLAATLPAPSVPAATLVKPFVASYVKPRPVSEVASVPSLTLTAAFEPVFKVVTLSVPLSTVALAFAATSRVERVTSASSVLNSPTLTCTVSKVLSFLTVNTAFCPLTM